MKSNGKKKEPQMKMGLQFPGSRFFEYLRYRLGAIATLLDQYTFWRSPLLWLIFFMNVIFAYLIFTYSIDPNLLPPSIPLFYYTSKSAPLLVDVSFIPYIVVVYLAVQLLTIYVASKLYFRLRTLSTFTLLMSILATIFFYLALYKSVTLALPIIQ